MTAITGPELLQLAAQYKGKPQGELARAAGYVKPNKDGNGTRSDYPGLQRALLNAHGHDFPESPIRNRTINYRLSVSKGGVLTIGKGYLVKLGAAAGDSFQVSIADGRLVLEPVASAPAAAVGAAAPDAAMTAPPVLERELAAA
jgi:hypothetical protein